MGFRHPFNLPAELVLMILDHLSLLDYFGISRVSLKARSFVLPTLHALTLEDRLDALERAAEDDHHGAILVLISILHSEITESEDKFSILHTLFRSSCTKAMRTWLTDLAPSAVPDHQWRKEGIWKETFKSAMRSSRPQALELTFEYGASLSALIDYHPFDDPVREMSPSLPKTESYYLHHAVIRGYQAVVDFLLARDGDAHINKTDPWGIPPLAFAVQCGWTGIVASLLANNANIDQATCKKGKCALQWAFVGGHESIALMLIDHGADVELADNDGNTALHYAVCCILWEPETVLPILKRLLERGASTAAVNRNGSTPLECAVALGNTEAVDLLFEQSMEANPHLRDEMTLLSFASRVGPETLALIVSYGVDVNRVLPNCFGRTLLQCVLMQGRPQCARILLEAGADPSKRDMYGLDAWDYAERSGLDFDFEDMLGQRP